MIVIECMFLTTQDRILLGIIRTSYRAVPVQRPTSESNLVSGTDQQAAQRRGKALLLNALNIERTVLFCKCCSNFQG